MPFDVNAETISDIFYTKTANLQCDTCLGNKLFNSLSFINSVYLPLGFQCSVATANDKPFQKHMSVNQSFQKLKLWKVNLETEIRLKDWRASYENTLSAKHLTYVLLSFKMNLNF